MQFGGQPTPWSEVEIEGLRLRSVSQILIQEIGAAGPENAEDSARRACGVIQRQADQIVSADARIAELEREIERLDAQWRDELRIYRETENARIAGLEADAGHLRTFARLRFGYAPGDYFGTCHHCAKEFIGDKRAMNCEACADAAIDAARANGGEG